MSYIFVKIMYNKGLIILCVSKFSSKFKIEFKGLFYFKGKV